MYSYSIELPELSLNHHDTLAEMLEDYVPSQEVSDALQYVPQAVAHLRELQAQSRKLYTTKKKKEYLRDMLIEKEKIIPMVNALDDITKRLSDFLHGKDFCEEDQETYEAEPFLWERTWIRGLRNDVAKYAECLETALEELPASLSRLRT